MLKEINQNELDLFSQNNDAFNTLFTLYYEFFNLNKHFILLKMQYNLLPLQNANAYLCVLFFLLSYMYMFECLRKVNNENKSPIQILYNRCNRVPQLPPYCTMVNDPNDQCCQMPYCQNPNPTPNPNPSPNGSPTVVSMQLLR